MASPETRHHSLGRLTTMIELKDMSNVTEIPFLSFEESRNRYWGVSDRDVPILIGAAAGTRYATFLISWCLSIRCPDQGLFTVVNVMSMFVFAGAVGLVFLILGAVLIWYCCQFAFKRDKSLYSKFSACDKQYKSFRLMLTHLLLQNYVICCR